MYFKKKERTILKRCKYEKQYLQTTVSAQYHYVQPLWQCDSTQVRNLWTHSAICAICAICAMCAMCAIFAMCAICAICAMCAIRELKCAICEHTETHRECKCKENAKYKMYWKWNDNTSPVATTTYIVKLVQSGNVLNGTICTIWWQPAVLV